jgi:uncharacterized PurR-regulated membrane protein YhhQ (DUF165 family)
MDLSLTSLVPLIAMVGLTYAVCVIAAALGVYATRDALIAYMLMIWLFAGKLAVYPGGFVSNVANIWYAAIIVMLIKVRDRGSEKLALGSIATTLYWLQIFFLNVSLLDRFPIIAGGFTAEAIHQYAVSMRRVALPSWSAFVLASGVTVGLTSRLRHRPSYFVVVAIAICAQAVDSLIFFPGAFGINDNMIEIMVTGFAAKCALSAIFATIFPVMTTWRRLIGKAQASRP